MNKKQTRLKIKREKEINFATPSKFPFIPPMRSYFGIYSSVLFIMKKF